MSEDAHHHEPLRDVERMYCAVCLFLQSRLFEILNGNQLDAALFHLPHKVSGEDRKEGSKKPPKWSPKPSSADPEDTPKRSLNPVLFKNRLLRCKLPGRFGVCLPQDLEMGPRLYIDIY